MDLQITREKSVRSQFLTPENHAVRGRLAEVKEAAALPYTSTREPFSTTPYRVEDPTDATIVVDWLVHSLRKAYRTTLTGAAGKAFLTAI